MKRVIFFFLIGLVLISCSKNVTAQSSEPEASADFKSYSDGKPSVTLSEWDNNTRVYQLYDRDGNLTFTLEEVRSSYSVSNRFRYHPNGAVKEVMQTTNPGASRYWYETKITFDNNNTPLWKSSKRMPEDFSSVSQGSTSFYWNKDTKKWIKQETVKEQDTPRK